MKSFVEDTILDWFFKYRRLSWDMKVLTLEEHALEFEGPIEKPRKRREMLRWWGEQMTSIPAAGSADALKVGQILYMTHYEATDEILNKPFSVDSKGEFDKKFKNNHLG